MASCISLTLVANAFATMMCANNDIVSERFNVHERMCVYTHTNRIDCRANDCAHTAKTKTTSMTVTVTVMYVTHTYTSRATNDYILLLLNHLCCMPQKQKSSHLNM